MVLAVYAPFITPFWMENACNAQTLTVKNAILWFYLYVTVVIKVSIFQAIHVQLVQAIVEVVLVLILVWVVLMGLLILLIPKLEMDILANLVKVDAKLVALLLKIVLIVRQAMFLMAGNALNCSSSLSMLCYLLIFQLLTKTIKDSYQPYQLL